MDNLGNGATVVIEDMPAGYTALDGMWGTSAATPTGSASVTIPVNSVSLNDAGWISGSAGSVHVPPNSQALLPAKAIAPSAYLVNYLKRLPRFLDSRDRQGVGVYVGETSQFDTNTITDPTGYDKSFGQRSRAGPGRLHRA